MSGIKHLKEVRDKQGDDFLNNLLNNFVIINENIDGAFFGLKKNQSNDRFKYFKKSGEITYVDRMLMKFYNPAVAHFELLPDNKKNRIPSNFYFGFQYVTNKDGGNSRFVRKPKNNLILTYIHRLDESGKPIETIQTKSDLERWAYYLEVEPPQIIFEGMLDDDQKSSILDFVYTSKSELQKKFETESFSRHIISVLNPESADSYLENGITGDISGIVFRFYDENDENSKANTFLAKLVDPIFKGKSESAGEGSKGRSNDYIWLIVIDLMNHFETYGESDLIKMCGDSDDYDSRYIGIIDTIFKDFISNFSFKYEGIELDTPEYLSMPEFDVDLSMISDEEVSKLIESNKTYKEIYRILSNFFRKTRKKSSSNFFTPDLIVQLNLIVKKIKRIVMGDAVYEGLFPSYGEFIGSDLNDNNYIGETEWFSKNKPNKKTEDVNILIGRFQPFHNGHLKCAESLKDKNGKKVVLIAIYDKKGYFSDRTVRILLEKAQQSDPDLIKDVRLVPSDSIKEIMEVILPEYSPVLWGSAEKRIKDYVLQMDYLKKRNVNLRISKDFKLVQLPSYLESSKVREMIQSNDFNSFKESVPNYIKSEFFNLTKEIKRNS